MKHLFILLLIVLGISGCSEDETKRYSSIEGQWAISSARISGSFTIANQGELTVVSGFFEEGGITHEVTKPTPLGDDYISLRGDGVVQLALLRPEIDPDNKVIIVKSFEVTTSPSDNRGYKDIITITRIE